jgi:hypothetical protein
VHLGNARRRNRLRIELGEDLLDRTAELRFEQPGDPAGCSNGRQRS